MGCRSGESTRLPPMCPEFNSWTARHMWAEFACSLPGCEGFSPGSPVSPFPQKTVFNLILFDLVCIASPISTSMLGVNKVDN